MRKSGAEMSTAAVWAAADNPKPETQHRLDGLFCFRRLRGRSVAFLGRAVLGFLGGLGPGDCILGRFFLLALEVLLAGVAFLGRQGREQQVHTLTFAADGRLDLADVAQLLDEAFKQFLTALAAAPDSEVMAPIARSRLVTVSRSCTCAKRCRGSGPTGTSTRAAEPKDSAPPAGASASINPATQPPASAPEKAPETPSGSTTEPDDSVLLSADTEVTVSAANILIEQRYISSLIRRTQSFAKYPRVALKRRHEGTVRLTVTLSPAGKVLDIEYEEKARYDTLNEAAQLAITSADPFPPLPPEIVESQFQFSVPIVFRLHQ